MAESTFAGMSFATHSVPDITADDYIVAFCTIPQVHCNNNALCYHAADFAAFKHLFSGRLPAAHQAWLSASDPRSLGTLRHGSKDVMRAFDSKMIVGNDPMRLTPLFLRQVKNTADAIRDNGQTKSSRLVVLVCGPTTPHQDILAVIPEQLTPTASPILLCTDLLKEAIGSSVDLVLVTPNMHTGGWVVSMTRSNPLPLKEHGMEQDFVMRRIIRNTAPLFVEASMRALLKKSSPMLLISESDEKTMMNPSPTKEQVQAKIRFYNAIHEAALAFMSSAPRMHAFNFSGDLDDWPHLCGPRLGPSLDEHYRCWRQLPGHAEESETRISFPFYCFGTNHAAQLMHLKTLAFALKPSWTTDSADTANRRLLMTLDAALELSSWAADMTESQIEQTYIHFIHTSIYRQAATNQADAMAALVGLAPPYSAHRQWETDFDNLGVTIEQRKAGLKACVLESVKGLIPSMPAETPRFMENHPPGVTYGPRTATFDQPLQFLWNAIVIHALEKVRVDPDTKVINGIEQNLLDMEDIFMTIRDGSWKELLRSPWVAGAGYSLVKHLNRKADSVKLHAGLLTGLSTGIGPMPSEIMRVSRTMDRSPGFAQGHFPRTDRGRHSLPHHRVFSDKLQTDLSPRNDRGRNSLPHRRVFSEELQTDSSPRNDRGRNLASRRRFSAEEPQRNTSRGQPKGPLRSLAALSANWRPSPSNGRDSTYYTASDGGSQTSDINGFHRVGEGNVQEEKVVQTEVNLISFSDDE